MSAAEKKQAGPVLAGLEEVPGWPGDYVRVLTALEMVDMADAGDTAGGLKGAIKFAAVAACDARGERVFADEAAAGAADWRRIKAIALEGFRLNGLLGEADGAEGTAGN